MEHDTLLEVYRRDRRELRLPHYLQEDLCFAVRYSPLRKDCEGLVTFTSATAKQLNNAA